jgi:hypothetical protein
MVPSKVPPQSSLPSGVKRTEQSCWSMFSTLNALSGALSFFALGWRSIPVSLQFSIFNGQFSIFNGQWSMVNPPYRKLTIEN